MPPPDLHSTAYRRLARSLMWGLGVMGLLSLLAPFVSYSIDLDDARLQARHHGMREALLDADALALRLLTMQGELLRLAERPEIDLEDRSFAPESLLLRQAHENSVLFRGGVALLDPRGAISLSVPEGLDLGESLRSRRWFQQALENDRPVFDRLGVDQDGWVALVPIRASGHRTVGFLIGIARDEDLPLAFGLAPTQRAALVDLQGRLLYGDGAGLAWARAHELAFSAPLGDSLRLWIFDSSEAVTATMRGRLVRQLLFLIVIQLITWLALALFLRRTYATFKSVEEKGAREERMAKLGMATSLIAHELKNTLNGLTTALGSESGSPEERELSRQVFRSQVLRLSNLARSLLSFGRALQPRVSELPLEPIVQGVLASLRYLPETAEATLYQTVPTGLTIRAERALVEAAVDNVVRNAIEAAVAAKDQGKVAEATVRLGGARRGTEILLSVEDNGGGFPPEFERWACEPFHTSKPKGIGLGLSTARQALEAFGGTIAFERIPGGSRVVLGFPTVPHEETP